MCFFDRANHYPSFYWVTVIILFSGILSLSQAATARDTDFPQMSSSSCASGVRNLAFVVDNSTSLSSSKQIAMQRYMSDFLSSIKSNGDSFNVAVVPFHIKDDNGNWIDNSHDLDLSLRMSQLSRYTLFGNARFGVDEDPTIVDPILAKLNPDDTSATFSIGRRTGSSTLPSAFQAAQLLLSSRQGQGSVSSVPGVDHIIILGDGDSYACGGTCFSRYPEHRAWATNYVRSRRNNNWSCTLNLYKNESGRVEGQWTVMQDCAREVFRTLWEFDGIKIHAISYDGAESTLWWLHQHTIDGGSGFYAHGKLNNSGFYLGSDPSAKALDSVVASLEPVEIETIFQFTFAGLQPTVSQQDPTGHSKYVYLPLFTPMNTARWSGNLKKYQLNDDFTLVDNHGNAVIDTETGLIKEGSVSLWSSTADGSDVGSGGAAMQIPNYASRGAFTEINGTRVELHESTAGITLESLNLHPEVSGLDQTAAALKRVNVLQWARGVIPSSEPEQARQELGALIHTTPVVVSYDSSVTDQSKDVVYFGSTEGFLHAVNAKTGQEIFRFLPTELLSSLAALYDNADSPYPIMGLDGPLTVWSNDVNADGIIGGEGGADDHVYLYAAMRRGGRSIFAFDVTDPTSPNLIWSKSGSLPGDPYEKLGQTWSKPTLSKFRTGPQSSDIKTVLLMGGGYDADQDTATAKQADDIGNAVFMIDAETGDLLWDTTTGVPASGSNGLQLAEMQYSIPADPTVIDINSDGFFDQMYVADVGGQVFRFDVVTDQFSGASIINGGRIASFAGDGLSEARRFFNKPDVSLIHTTDGKDTRIAVAIGSGSRFDPLNTEIQERFYVFFQNEVSGIPASYRTITEIDLSDSPEKGWFMSLDTGEKVLSPSLTLNNTVFFTTFYYSESSGSTQTENACTTTISGESRLRSTNVYNGELAVDYTNDGKINTSDAYKKLKSIGIPPSPSIFLMGDGAGLLVGAERPLSSTSKKLKQKGWQDLSWTAN
jgi:type IV pilus assembly protein PilY1